MTQETTEELRVEGIGWARAIKRSDFAAAALCVVVGVVLSILPHLIWWARAGSPVWFADLDDLLYLSVASQAYFNHPLSLSDPTLDTGGATIYSWWQLGPAILVARMLALGPATINLTWRIWAGLSIGLSWYLVMRFYVGRPWVAAALACLMLADIGSISGRLLVNHVWYFTMLATGQSERLMLASPVLGTVPILAGIPGACPQWRIITPGLSFAFLLVYVWLVARARARPTWPRLVAAGVSFGLLFHIYFYYWTAAGLALLLALALDAGHRRVYFYTGLIGGLLGLPALISGFLIKRAYPADWLERSDVFVPIGRLSHLLIPKVALSLLVVTGVLLVWAHRKDLIHVWALAAAGLLWTDHQLLTGLEIQNMHWQWYVSGPMLCLLLVLLAAGLALDRVRWPRAVVAGLLVLLGVHLAIGFAVRASEATQNRMCVEILDDYARYRAQRLGPSAARLEPNVVLAGDPRFLELAAALENERPLDHYASLFSPSTRDDEWYMRMALNGYLRGLSRPAFEDEQQRDLAGAVWGPWSRDPARRAESLAERLAAYDRVAADPPAALAHFRVRYVALPAGQGGTPSHLENDWVRLESGGSWDLWEYRHK
ncbi:MAG TPA: hypothetical protein VGZ22_28390 [Isosphaeraceae bacterium]|nr:hypothetical protein [Isosphaeraceae bacterium]